MPDNGEAQLPHDPSAPDLGRPQYVSVGDGQLHLRSWGQGAPVVLLHNAGNSSAGWADFAGRLSELNKGLLIVAPDLIGTGGTTLDPSSSGDLVAQADAVVSGVRALGVEQCVVLGDGAGAAVARVAAQRHSDFVAEVVVMQAPVEASEGEPPSWPAPDPQGAALLAMWDETIDGMIFSPWWKRVGANRLQRGLPSAPVIHEVFLDIAEHNGAHRALAQSASRQWAELAPGQGERSFSEPDSDPFAILSELTAALPHATISADREGATGNGTYSYSDVLGVRIHTRQFGQGLEGRPLLLLHSNPGSGQGLEGLAAEIGKSRPTIVWDTPGHGRSQDLQGEMAQNPTLADVYAQLLVGLLDSLGVDQCDVYGTHTGAGLAAELAIAAPSRVASVVLDGVPLFDDNPTMVDQALANYFIDLHPDAFGSHIRRAWGTNVNTGLWWPHYNHTVEGVRTSDAYPAELVHGMTLDMLRSAPHYARYYRAAWTWKATSRLPLIPHRTLVGTTPTDPLAAMTPTALALLPAGQEGHFAPFGREDSIPVTARTITDFLDGEE